MTKLPDYSDYLNREGMLSYIEEEWLRNSHIHEAQARFVNDAIEKYGIKTVLEVGCATGNCARLIDDTVQYTGIDKNMECLKIARQKNPNKMFTIADIRKTRGLFDLVFAFAILKHFSLDELPIIFDRILSMGKYVIFDMPIADESKDDGEEYHHTWLTEWDIMKMVGATHCDIDYANPIEPMFLVKGLK